MSSRKSAINGSSAKKNMSSYASQYAFSRKPYIDPVTQIIVSYLIQQAHNYMPFLLFTISNCRCEIQSSNSIIRIPGILKKRWSNDNFLGFRVLSCYEFLFMIFENNQRKNDYFIHYFFSFVWFRIYQSRKRTEKMNENSTTLSWLHLYLSRG